MNKAKRGKKIAIILVLVFFLLFTFMSVVMYFIKPETTEVLDEENIKMTGEIEDNNNLYDSTGLVITGFEA